MGDPATGQVAFYQRIHLSTSLPPPPPPVDRRPSPTAGIGACLHARSAHEIALTRTPIGIEAPNRSSVTKRRVPDDCPPSPCNSKAGNIQLCSRCIKKIGQVTINTRVPTTRRTSHPADFANTSPTKPPRTAATDTARPNLKLYERNEDQRGTPFSISSASLAYACFAHPVRWDTTSITTASLAFREKVTLSRSDDQSAATNFRLTTLLRSISGSTSDMDPATSSSSSTTSPTNG